MERMGYAKFVIASEDQDIRLIDVREPFEFSQGHVKGAELFPMSAIQNGELPENDGRTVALICRSGSRSAMVASILESQGFEHTINIEGGTLAAASLYPEHIEK